MTAFADPHPTAAYILGYWVGRGTRTETHRLRAVRWIVSDAVQAPPRVNAGRHRKPPNIADSTWALPVEIWRPEPELRSAPKGP